jgi:hypothetical protein
MEAWWYVGQNTYSFAAPLSFASVHLQEIFLLLRQIFNKRATSQIAKEYLHRLLF